MQTADDWRYRYEERAAILEHEAGMSRDQAEATAREQTRAEFEREGVDERPAVR